MSDDIIKFTNQVDDTNWSFKKISDAASKPSVEGNKVTFGFPGYSQVVYPNQTIRINHGW